MCLALLWIPHSWNYNIFTCRFWTFLFHSLCDYFNIEKVFATAYHQQTNGKTEKFVKFLKDSLATAIRKDQLDWDDLVDSCLFTNRVSLNQTLKDSPFFLIYGRDPLLPNDLFLPLVRNKFRKGEAIEIYEHKTHKQVDYDEGEQVLIYTPA